MLGKTAGGLFWMSRYLERAENVARLLETGQRMALTRSNDATSEWHSILRSAGVLPGYLEKHETVVADRAIDWMLRDADNSSSIRSVIKQARDNARLVRTALTYEVWSAINGSWMKVDDMLRRKVNERDLPGVLEAVRQKMALVRGSNLGTMMRNDIFDFLRLGTLVERADNTGRILDVKYYVLLPTTFAVGSSLDNVQWESILRSVGAGGGYRLTHGERTSAAEIAEFMILDEHMPRSIRFCCRKIVENLSYLERDFDISCPSRKDATEIYEQFCNQTIDGIFDFGLHEYIQTFLGKLGALNRQIEIDYRFYE